MAKANVKSVNGNSPTGLFSTYLGFVQSSVDTDMMGRLRVWIPTINSDKDLGTFTVSYLSPFAGASSLTEGAQKSYGFWAIPDVGDEVVVLFINGDPNRGIWIGCLYQQFMNHMVPGIASSKLDDGSSGPSKEYDKKGKDASSSMDPPRPMYNSLSDALKNQGLSSDYYRGQTTSSARRSPKSDVIGILSPGGNQFVMDDNEDDSFIRLRTNSGTQLLVNDSIGMIYAISKNGNSWVEISDNGIDVYTSKTLSFRSQQDMNFHSDGNINFFSANSINMSSIFDTKLVSGTNFNIGAGSKLSQQSEGKFSISSGADLALSGNGNIGIDSGSNTVIRSCGTLGLVSCDSINMKSSKIMNNSGSVQDPIAPDLPDIPTSGEIADRELNVSSGYQAIKTVTIVSRLPTHEPFMGHPTSSTKPSNSGINNNISSRSNDDDSKSTSTSSPSDTKAGTQSNTTNTQSSNKSDWWIPVTGIVSSPYADTSAAVHKNGHDGVDIAAPQNSIIRASRSGKVIHASYGVRGSGYYGYGNCVAIDHGDGNVSLYGHMNSLGCVMNQKIEQGQTIGYVGNTGHSTGNHCHFGLYLNGKKFNPASMIPILGKKGASVKSGKQT